MTAQAAAEKTGSDLKRFLKRKLKSKKKEKKAPKQMGSPKIPFVMKLPEKSIVFEQILYWIDFQATQEEVAGSFHVSVETLNARLLERFGLTYSELLKRCGGQAKLALRRNQFVQSKTNATMAIWLGKQWLGQRDHEKDQLPPNDAALNNLFEEIHSLKGETNAAKQQTKTEHTGSDEAV